MEKFKFNYKPAPYCYTGEFGLEDIDKIYVGKGDQCRCGCGGNYHEEDGAGKTRAFNRFKKLVRDGNEVTGQDKYIFETVTGEAPNGQPRVITIYLKKAIR